MLTDGLLSSTYCKFITFAAMTMAKCLKPFSSAKLYFSRCTMRSYSTFNTAAILEKTGITTGAKLSTARFLRSKSFFF